METPLRSLAQGVIHALAFAPALALIACLF